MSTQYSSSMAVKRLGSAVALSAGLLMSIGVSIEPVYAGTESAINNITSPAGASPIGLTVVHGSNPLMFADILFGTSFSCGGLELLTQNPAPATGFQEMPWHAFTGNSGDACNPGTIGDFGGHTVVTSQTGGASSNGAVEVFNPANTAIGLPYPVPSPNGVTPLPSSEAPQSRGDAPASAETVYITANYQIYEAALTASGKLSKPKLIYTFPSADNHKDGVVLSGPAEFGPDGNLYGATNQGGKGYGVIYKLTPVTVGGKTTWTETVLHTFTGGADGGRPWGQLAIDSAGNLYGTTTMGGELDGAPTNCSNNGFAGCGVVFELLYRATGTLWTEKILYSFSGAADGAIPMAGVVLDPHNNLFGTTFAGGNTNLAACSGAAIGNTTPGCGVVFELTGKKYPRTESVPYAFMGGADGAEPQSAVILNGRDIFGTTVAGGNTTDAICGSGEGLGYAKGCGVVFEITP